MAFLKLIKNHEMKTEEWLVSFRCGNYPHCFFDILTTIYVCSSDAELSIWLKEGWVGSCITAAPLDTDVELSKPALKHPQAVAAKVINKTHLRQTIVASHNNLFELFHVPALEELVGAVSDIHLEVDPCVSADYLHE